MSTLTLLPLEPKSPSDLLAAMVLSPAMSPSSPLHIPLLSLSPPTPYTSRFKATGKDSNTAPRPDADSTATSAAPQAIHRPLLPSEAHQLSLLITQYLSPVRANPKGLMRESIVLAEDLHQAGIRWDKKRRVMGTHLRVIWEEGQRYSGGKGASGQSRLEIFVQGNFMSVAEQPHPLDPLPIPIAVKPEVLPALPQTSLSSALAASTPCLSLHSLSRSPSIHSPGPAEVDMNTSPARVHAKPERPGSGPGIFTKKTWRSRKNAGLKIKVDPYRNPDILAKTTPLILSSRRNTFASILPWKTLKAFAPNALTKSIHTTKNGRRVSFGGYEVR